MMGQHGDKTDSRCEVVEWFVENENLGERVFFEKELAFLPSELARLPHLAFSADRESLRHDLEASSGDILVVGVKLRQELGEMEPPGLVLLSVGSKETPPRPAQWRKNSQKIFAVRVQ